MGGSESIETNPDMLTGKDCKDGEHSYNNVFKCDQQHCESFICRMCIGY